MATQLITVNSILVFESGWSVNPASVLSNASDGSTATTFQNSSTNQSLTFDLEGTSDYTVLANAASIESVQLIVTFAAGGKGSGTLDSVLLDLDGNTLQGDSLSESSTSQTDNGGTIYTPNGGIDPQILDLMQVRLVTTNGTICVISRVRAEITYTAQASSPANPGFSMDNPHLGINGKVILDSGQINI